jgi:hypothetical protein
MKSGQFISLPLLALFLSLAPTALASTTWYVNGVSGSDSNTCMSPQTACKTIGHAISLASSGDSIIVAAATYTENLTIGFSLALIGSGATTTIIDGGGVNTVVTIPNATARVILSGMTIHNGVKLYGAGGIYNAGTLSLIASTVSGNANRVPCRASAYPCSFGGGGISNAGTLTISDSTVANNSAYGGCTIAPFCVLLISGGGIYNGGTMVMSNSTLASNSVGATPVECQTRWFEQRRRNLQRRLCVHKQQYAQRE